MPLPSQRNGLVAAVAVFVLSATIYCSVDRNQCIVVRLNPPTLPQLVRSPSNRKEKEAFNCICHNLFS